MFGGGGERRGGRTLRGAPDGGRMERTTLATRPPRAPAAMRWRGGEITRLEAFSDAVFGFAVTLLVVSLEVPASFDALLLTLRGFAAFAVSFFILLQIWYYHFLFFRRYALQDLTTMALNGALLLVVLAYVYPLKFLFTLLVNQWLGIGGPGQAIGRGQAPTLMLVYGLGFTAIFFLFALLHVHAWRRREALAMDADERRQTRHAVEHHLLLAGVGGLSIAIVAFGRGDARVALAGWSYALIGPLLTLHGHWAGRGRRSGAADAGEAP
jgi:uncharacterized membrane protein